MSAPLSEDRIAGIRAHSIPGAQRTAIGITGNQGAVETGTFDDMAGVQEVIRVSKPYKLVSRDVKILDTLTLLSFLCGVMIERCALRNFRVTSSRG